MEPLANVWPPSAPKELARSLSFGLNQARGAARAFTHCFENDKCDETKLMKVANNGGRSGIVFADLSIKPVLAQVRQLST